jgi:hypothetical protein
VTPAKERKLNDWVDAFITTFEGVSSPHIFRRWAAISAISGALERKVSTRSRVDQLFPNLYVVLVGPPGVGKGVVLNPVRELWNKLDGVHVATSSCSRASLVDQLSRADRAIVRPDQSTYSFNSLLVASAELGVFLSAYDDDFISVLQDLYDCKSFSEEKRTAAIRLDIEHPQLVFFAATTPSYLNSLFPLGAWDQGLASRAIFVYSGEEILGDIFVDEAIENKDDLVHDLRQINALQGSYVWEKEAAIALTLWYKSGRKPVPAHPKLLGYNSRRHAQIMKLSMIAAASESDELCIRLRHYQRALDWLLEAEAYMADIFKAGMGSDKQVMEEAWHFAYQTWVKKKEGTTRAAMLTFLSERVPIHNVARMLEMMLSTHMLVLNKDRYEPRNPTP